MQILAESSTNVGQAILPAAAFKAALDSCCGALRRRLKPAAATIGCPTNLAQLFPDSYLVCSFPEVHAASVAFVLHNKRRV